MNAIRIQRADEPSSKVKLSSIRIDGGTQSRANVSDAVVEDYAAAMADGAAFPKMVVFYDGADHWLADGFHRHKAYLKACIASVEADVRQGTRREAILFSVGANATHGHRRTNDDKRRAVLTLLNDEEWGTWSDREIGRRAAVSNQFVSNLRLSVNGGQMEPVRTVSRNGSTYQQNTSAIGNAGTPGNGGALKSEGFDQLPPMGEVDEDEITAEDLANDPGFQKAAEALNAAKALYDEAKAMPAREPLTEQEIADGQRAFGTQEQRSDLIEVIRVTELVTKLPSPSAMVGHIPPVLMHTVDVVGLLNVSAWFENFARAWEEKGTSK
jgi:hypothetical protein